MGRATSVKEKINFSGADSGCACRPGSMVCAYLRSGGKGATAICRVDGANGWAGGCAWGASGNAEASIDQDIASRRLCHYRSASDRSEKRRRRQESRKEFVKAPLRFRNSACSSLCEPGVAQSAKPADESSVATCRYGTLTGEGSPTRQLNGHKLAGVWRDASEGLWLTRRSEQWQQPL